MNTFELDTELDLLIPANEVQLSGLLFIPATARCLVIFVHGSGSSHLSSRNQYVAKYLQLHGCATLLFDLLTREEDVADEQTRAYRFNIPFLAKRLLVVTHWLRTQEQFNTFTFGFFGASTGAAAALMVAGSEPDLVDIVVSRGGRPDLAGEYLIKVRAATLLIVGGHDEIVIGLNQEAFEKLNCKKQLVIVPEATHLFEEPGKLAEVARLAAEWFGENG